MPPLSPENTLLKSKREARIHANLRHSDNNQGEEDDNQSPPLRLLQRLLEPVLTNHSGEENDGTTNHLPNTDGDPQETDEHDEGGSEIAEGREEHLVIHRLHRTSILDVPFRDPFSFQNLQENLTEFGVVLELAVVHTGVNLRVRFLVYALPRTWREGRTFRRT